VLHLRLQGTIGGYDLAAWSTLLQPLVKLWEQLLALAPPALRQAINSSSSSSSAASAAASAAAGGSGASSQMGPVDSFLGLERAFGVALLQVVARTMAGVKAVLSGESPTAAVQVGLHMMRDVQRYAELVTSSAPLQKTHYHLSRSPRHLLLWRTRAASDCG
jgi:hypothetical protein